MKHTKLLRACLAALLLAPGAACAENLPFAAAVKENGKWGAVGAEGETIIPARYDAVDLSLEKENREADLESMENRADFLEVRDGKLRGFYRRDGREIVPALYEARSLWLDGALAVQTEKKHIGFYREDGQKLSDPIYEEVSDFHDGYALVKRDGKYGYLAKDGAEISPAYKEARYFKDGFAPVKDKKWGAIDTAGNLVIPCEYDDAGPAFSDGLLAVKKDNRWGFVDAAGKEIIPLTYRTVQPIFTEGLTAVQNEDKLWGFVNNKGETTAEPIFKNILTPFSEGLAGVLTQDGKAYARPDGTIAFHADFDRIYPFEDGLAEYREGQLVERRRSSIPIGISIGWGWGWHHHHHHHPWGWGVGWPGWGPWGPWWYDDWYAPSRIDTQEKRGYIDAEGKIIASASLAHVYPATGKGILVFNNNRFGWIDRAGTYTIHTEYRVLTPDLEEDFLLARDEERNWGLLDFSGNTLAPFSYDDMKNLGSGLIAYKKDGKWGLMDKTGAVLSDPLYAEIGNCGNGLLPAKLKNTWLYLSADGAPAIHLEGNAQNALPFKEGRAGVKQDGKWGIIDTEGKWIVPPKYEGYKQL